jgi:TonB family protein
MRGLWISLAAMFAATSAWSAEPLSLFVFTARPSEIDTKAAFPPPALARKITGEVDMSCLITAELTLAKCDVERESPAGEGFGAAALGLTSRYHLRETDELGRRVAGRYAPVSITFLAPGDRGLDWAKKPTGQQMLAVLPKLAFEHGVGGKTSLHCDVTAAGALEACVVEWETPSGYGFGAAALKLADQFRFKPKMRSGKPVADEASIPVIFHGDMNDAGPIAGLVRDPVWDLAPMASDMAAAFPKTAGDLAEGQVVLRCGIAASGVLTACKTITDAPKDMGFGDAALGLASRFKIRMSTAGKLDLTKYVVDVPFHFRNPSQSDSRVLERPTWTESINPAFMNALYPAAAKAAGLKTGVGEVNCAVDARGKLSDCRITRQQPEAVGFGAAALTVAEIMAMNIWTKGGDPVDGLRFTLPVRFNWQPPAAATPDPAAQPATPQKP